MKKILSPMTKVGMAVTIIFGLTGQVNAADVKLGGKIYGGTCVACHGKNGKGEIPGVPDFTSAKGPLAKTDAILLDHIINGFESPGSDMAMPELGGNEDLTEQDAKNVIAYMRAKFQRQK